MATPANAMTRPGPAHVDPRGSRFGAAVTTVLLIAIIILGPRSLVAALLLAIQTVAFAIGTVLGPAVHPYGWLYRRLLRPRLGPPAELEDAAPPRFAQGVGLVFAVVGGLGAITGLAAVFYVALCFALAAAFLNAAFGVCLGCQVYLIIQRLTSRAG